MIEVVCSCKWRFEVQDEHAGLSIKCPRCRRLVDVPAKGSAPIAAEPDVESQGPGSGATPVDRPGSSHAAAVASSELEALRTSIDRLVVINRSINSRLAWIVALLALLLVRVLLRR